MTAQNLQSFAYPVLLKHAPEGDWIATVPDVPEVLTGGATQAEALLLAEDALEEAVLARLAAGEAVPQPTERDDATGAVLLPPVTAGRVLIDEKRRQAGWSKLELGRRISKDEKVVRRILDGRGGVSMTTVQEALTALGCSTTLAWR